MDIRKWHDKYSIDIQLVYNSEATRDNYINIFCDDFSKKLSNIFKISDADIKAIILIYIIETLQIKANNIVYSNKDWRIGHYFTE